MTTVQIEQGTVAGSLDDGVHRFLGIPYAAPPVGDLRWAAPVPPAPWSGVREATVYGNAAIQTIDTGFDLGADQSEDCLYLNVWTTSTEPDARQPVMVWIHGGGFLNGAASMKTWAGESLARRGVTVVSLNYRLGAFGFLTHPEVGGNFGVLDWVAALQWVAENITAFGGDPSNVTVFGQSAGGAAVRALLSTPSANGLFHRGVIQSAGFEDYAVVGSPSYRRSTAAVEGMFSRLGSRDLAELRRLPAEQVREAAFALAGTVPPPGQLHTPANLVWYPVTDGHVMTADFSGWPSGVSVLFGCTQDEARGFHRPTGIYSQPELDPAEVYVPATLEQMAKALGGTRADEILAHFADRSSNTYEAIAELSTAAIWWEPALATYRRFAELDRDTYYYRFARVSPATRRSGLLAYHSSELPYIFGGVSLSGTWAALGATRPTGTGDGAGAGPAPAPANFDETDVQVSQALQHAWVEFARTGVPRSPDGTPWPACAASAPQYTVLGDAVEVRPLDVEPLTRLISSTRGSSPGA